MSYETRIKLIEKLQQIRGSKVLTCVTGDRLTNVKIAGMETNLAAEPQLQIYDHLMQIGKVEKIDLFLYTRGGETDSVLPLVNAAREFCNTFTVLVPFRAHSAGTLLCLGADEIIMGPFGELSPIDPTTGNQFSPVDELNPKQRRGISVEDVTSYVALAKEKVGIRKEDELLEVYKILSQSVHPLALGHVNRVHNHIRILAQRLLELGNKRNLSASKIKEIVDTLTEKLCSHTHSIGRKDAQQIMGADILKFATAEEQTSLWELFEEYAGTLYLRERFNVKEYMDNEQSKEIKVTGAFIESEKLSHIFECTSVIRQRSELPPNYQIQVQAGQPIPLVAGFPTQFSIELIRMGWKKNEGSV